MKKLVGIDGNSIMNRAFYGIMNSKLLMTSDGIYTNAIYGFLSILNKLIVDENPDYICVAFDLKAPTFRHEKYEGYKATRKGMPDELRVQMPIIKDILRAMNIKILEMEGYEADDILGTLAKYGEDNEMDVLLLTGDRDYLQLASDKVTVRIPTTKMGKTESTDYTPEVILEKFGIKPIQFIETKALMGDTSDNIPGVPGVGEKTAFSLITKYETVDTIYNALDKGEELEGIKGKLKEKLVENKELAYLSKDLGTIFREVPLTISIDEIKKEEPNNDELYNLFTKLQLKKFIDSMGLKAGETATNVEFDDSSIEIEDLEKLDLKDVTEFSYYFSDGLAVFVNDKSYYKKNPSIEDIKKVFDNDILKIGYLEKDMYLYLKKNGITPKNFMFDLEIAAYIMNPSKSSYKLDDIIMEELNIIVENKKQDEQISFAGFGEEIEDNKEQIARYARYIYKCKEKYQKELEEKNQLKLFNEIEMPLLKVLAEMEYEGVFVDREMLDRYSIDLNQKVDNLMKDIWELAGIEFNINSPKQLRRSAFRKIKFNCNKENKNRIFNRWRCTRKIKRRTSCYR